jgi:epoxyqueuosine reductase
MKTARPQRPGATVPPNASHPPSDGWASLAAAIKVWGREIGFQAVGISDLDVSAAAHGLGEWLTQGHHGEMGYMQRHAAKRTDPQQLVPGTIRIITARMDYLPRAAEPWGVLEDATRAYIARYALGRDYHKVLRARLEQLASRIRQEVGALGYRVFTDSAPVMEVELARKAGLGWRGKHTLLLSRDAGSYFFIGEIFVDIPLPADPPVDDHCGTCERCIEICPTRAILAPYVLDARRCISYLTIELKGSIPIDLRPLIGNRVYGCDDCQLVCPWNKFARETEENDFAVRHGLDAATLLELFAWDAQQFETRLAGNAIHRIGYERWLRNLAVGLGNAPHSEGVVRALGARSDHPSALVREHVAWALERQSRTKAPLDQ